LKDITYKLEYRPEIDGLRAWAVLPVVLFHASLPGFSGGFIGVDIFFVISGYLITTILLTELNNDSFSIINFYERRARRILPALFVVVISCLPLAFIWMSPDQLLRFGKALVAVPTFISNFLFWQESGYFAEIAKETPLLHTWSLAVEEQYYIAIPMILWVLWYYTRKWIFVIFALGSIASFIIALQLHKYGSSTAFFFSMSRAWELGAGSLLALLNRNGLTSHRWGDFLTFTGLFLLTIGFVFIDEASVHPGYLTVIPVIGTALIIQFARADGWISKTFLSNRLFNEIGRMSYSLYLWHYPLFAFAHLYTQGELSPTVILLLLVLTAVFAFASYRFVEKPLRNKTKFGRAFIFTFAGTMSATVITLGFWLTSSNGLPSRYPDEVVKALTPEGLTNDCSWTSPLPEYPQIKVCAFGDTSAKRKVVLWGDSHASATWAALNDSLKDKRLKGWYMSNNYCNRIVTLYESSSASDNDIKQCQSSLEVMSKMLADANLSSIVIAIRWTYRLYPVEGAIGSYNFDNGEEGVESAMAGYSYALDKDGKLSISPEDKSRAMQDFIRYFEKFGANVIVQYPVPEVGWDVPSYLHKHYLNSGELPKSLSTSFDRYKARNKFVIDNLDAVGKQDKLFRLYPQDVLCNTLVADRCVAYLDGVTYYMDDDHVSKLGSTMLIDTIKEYL
jgi:peptidoglycan/LPS O-acetylase OafA/YrhL